MRGGRRLSMALLLAAGSGIAACRTNDPAGSAPQRAASTRAAATPGAANPSAAPPSAGKLPATLPSSPSAAPSSAGTPSAPPTAPATAPALAAPSHVIIISQDGLRPDVFSEELTPRHMAFMREGAVARRARTIPHSDTLPSHASMLSGFGSEDHGLWWNSFLPRRGYIHVPTIFSVAEAHGLSTAMIVGKPKLRHIAKPGTVGHFERPSYLCGGVARRAGAYFAEHRPGLLFVHFSDPDEYGHSHGWMSREYQRAVARADRCLASFLEALDRSDAAKSTLVILTADHGGRGHHHSGANGDVDRTIPWMVRGPGVVPGSVLDVEVGTVDTAATALAALGLPLIAGMRGVPVPLGAVRR